MKSEMLTKSPRTKRRVGFFVFLLHFIFVCHSALAVRGDFNGSGELDHQDLQELDYRLVKIIPAEGMGNRDFDMNADRILDASDLIRFQVMTPSVVPLLYGIPYVDHPPSRFQSHTESTRGITPPYYEVDLDSDGDEDRVAFDKDLDLLNISINNGDETFIEIDRSPGIDITGEEQNRFADFNGDELQDLVLLTNQGFRIFLQGSDYQFSAPAGVHPAILEEQVEIGHFNEDSFLDLIATCGFGPNCSKVYFGNGDGTLQESIDYSDIIPRGEA